MSDQTGTLTELFVSFILQFESVINCRGSSGIFSLHSNQRRDPVITESSDGFGETLLEPKSQSVGVRRGRRRIFGSPGSHTAELRVSEDVHFQGATSLYPKISISQ